MRAIIAQLQSLLRNPRRPAGFVTR